MSWIFFFNNQKIVKATITDHPWKKPDRSMITKELILNLLRTLNGQKLKAIEYRGERKVYKWETLYNDKRYRLIFWFENSSSDWIWVRNCYLV